MNARPSSVLVVAPSVQQVLAPDERRIQIKGFLRAKRANIRPEQLGLSRGTRRLTPGLRREEVALSADVGLSWYTWLEQGRPIGISASTLSRVADALQLTEADRAYLFWLAGVPHPNPSAFAGTLPPAISAMLQSYQGPAVILSPLFDLIATNYIGEQVFEFSKGIEPFPTNQLWQLIMNSARRRLYTNYDLDVRHFVGFFRLTSVSFIGQPTFHQLIDALMANSPLFRALWNEQHTQAPAPYSTSLHHPSIGALHVFSCRLPMPSIEGGYLMMLSPSDADTAESFAHLARAAPPRF